MRSKGMSQTLALIVAASVFMMAALTLIFMFQQGVGDLSQDTGRQSCLGALQTMCASSNAQVATPGSCISNGQRAPSIPSGYGIGTTTTSCSTFNENFN